MSSRPMDTRRPVVRFLSEKGMDAKAFETRFKDEGEDEEEESLIASPGIASAETRGVG